MANATIRVQFGTPDGGSGGSNVTGHLSAEIDTRPDGLNGGRNVVADRKSTHLEVFC